MRIIIACVIAFAFAVCAGGRSALAQLYSSVQINTSELGGFAAPPDWKFFSQEFWVVQHWRSSGVPVSTHAMVVAIDPQRLANIAEDALRVAGVHGDAQKPFAYSERDAAADAISAGRAGSAIPIVCGAPMLALDAPANLADGPARALELLQVRAGRAWASVVTHTADSASRDAAQKFVADCPGTVAAALAQAPPAGWASASPAWIHEVATWTTPQGSVDLVKLDPATPAEVAAATALTVADAGNALKLQSATDGTRCGVTVHVAESSGPPSFISSGRVRETVIPGKNAVYVFIENEEPKAKLPDSNAITSFCPAS